jgi:transcriptional regulator with XRE-family HTH domain
MTGSFQISLKAARVNANLTILEASKLIGIGKDTLMKYERDSGLVTPNRQQDFCRAYNISVDNIRFG